MVYTNLKFVNAKEHGIFESSRLKATDVGRVLDLIVRDEDDKEIDVDNGVALKVGESTGDGLQTRYATVAGVKDKVYIAGSVALIKDAFTKAQEQAYNFYNVAGSVVKGYEVLGDDYEVFAVASYQFTGDALPKVGQYVVLDGNGMYTAQDAKPDETSYGFIGRVHSIASGIYYTTVRIECIQNKQLA